MRRQRLLSESTGKTKGEKGYSSMGDPYGHRLTIRRKLELSIKCPQVPSWDTEIVSVDKILKF